MSFNSKLLSGYDNPLVNLHQAKMKIHKRKMRTLIIYDKRFKKVKIGIIRGYINFKLINLNNY